MTRKTKIKTAINISMFIYCSGINEKNRFLSSQRLLLIWIKKLFPTHCSQKSLETKKEFK
jgi:hypothetical protein